MSVGAGVEEVTNVMRMGVEKEAEEAKGETQTRQGISAVSLQVCPDALQKAEPPLLHSPPVQAVATGEGTH